jgi:hypothetical protein
MAFITIITGSHEFRDDFNYFLKAYRKQQLYKYTIDGVSFKKNRFDRVIITKDNEVIYLPPVIATLGYNKFSCTQTMGSGKTVLGMEHLARIHHNGGNTDANLSVAWFKHNQGKLLKQWLPSVNSLEDFERANKTTVLFDDIKHTISRWNAEESEFISAIVNQSRKEMLNIIITTQRVINFVPPNIREVCTNYEIPYVTIRDQRVESPDNMGMPLEMEVLNISANGVFIGFGLFNGLVCDGTTILPTKRLLESYSTLEVAVDLKTGDTKPQDAIGEDIIKEPYKGYLNEKVVYDKLTGYVGELKHLSAENSNTHLADIELNNGKRYLIDVVGVGGKGKKKMLNTGHKNIPEWVEKIKKLKAVPLYAYSINNMIFLVKCDFLIGKSGKIALSKELRKRSHSCEFFFTNRLS